MKKNTVKPTPEVEAIFNDVINSIPELIAEWAKQNDNGRMLPYHYDVLYLEADLGDNYRLTVEMKRTVTGGRASYDDPEAIMQAFKRAHVIIALAGTMKAYDLHLRYDKDRQGYMPLKMDMTRLRTMDAKHHALARLVSMQHGNLSDSMRPAKSKGNYPHVLRFNTK